MTRHVKSLAIVRVRSLCLFRTLPDPIPYAARSDSVRYPIGFRMRTARTHIGTIKGQFNITIELP